MVGGGQKLRLYGHSYCSLCDAMQAQLLALAGELGFELEVVDIHDAPELEARFGELVPALCIDDEMVCHHQLDEAALRTRLSACPEPARMGLTRTR